jgi:hypothetical protein
MNSDHNTMGSVNIIDARDQKPTEAKPEKKSRTAEQEKLWQEARDKAHKRMFPNAKDEPKEKPAKAPAKDAPKEDGAKADDKPKAEPKPPAKETPKEPADSGEGKQTEDRPKAETPKPEPKATAKKEVATPPVDIERLAKSVAKETAEAMSKKNEPKPDEDVPEARRRDLAAIDHLDSNNPKYKGAGAKFRKFAKDEAAFISQWEARHPGESFDPDSDEHAAWYDKHEPDIDPRDVLSAEVEIAAERKAEQIAERKSAATRKELDSIKLEREVERAERPVGAFVNRGIAVVAASLGEDIAKAFTELKEGETLEGKDPAAHQAIVAAIPDLQRQTVAAARIFGTEGRAYDANDPDHTAVAQSALELQAEVQQWPEDRRTSHGKLFATLDEWANMTDAQKARHWTISADLMSAYLAKKAGEKAAEIYKNRRAEVEKMLQAYGYVKNGAAQTAQTAPNVEREETPTEREKPRSPSTSTATVIQPGSVAKPKTSRDWADVMLDKMHRR